MTKRHFRAALEAEADGGHFIRNPFDVHATFGKRGHGPVRGTLNGLAFRASLFPYGGVHVLGLNKAIRMAARIEPGDEAWVVIEGDDAPRVVKPPADLARALKGNASAPTAWRRLNHTRRKEYAQTVVLVKKPETRKRTKRKCDQRVDPIASLSHPSPVIFHAHLPH